MSKIHHTSDGRFMFFCPGCKCGHGITTPPWTFNGDMEKPTIRASVLVKSVYLPDDADFSGVPLGERHPDTKDTVCHSFVTDGNIQFLGDCTHELAGKTVPLEDF